MLLILHEIVQCHWSPCLDRTVSLYCPVVVATQAPAWAANHLCLKGLQQAAVDHLGFALHFAGLLLEILLYKGLLPSHQCHHWGTSRWG